MTKKLHLYLENGSLTNQGMNTGTNIVHTSNLAVGVQESRLVYGKPLPFGEKTVIVLFNPQFEEEQLVSISGFEVKDWNQINSEQLDILKKLTKSSKELSVPAPKKKYIIRQCDSDGDLWYLREGLFDILTFKMNPAGRKTFDSIEEAEKFSFPGTEIKEIGKEIEGD